MRVPGPPQPIGFNRRCEVVVMRRAQRFESNELVFQQTCVGKIHSLSLVRADILFAVRDQASPGLGRSARIDGLDVAVDNHGVAPQWLPRPGSRVLRTFESGFPPGYAVPASDN